MYYAEQIETIKTDIKTGYKQSCKYASEEIINKQYGAAVIYNMNTSHMAGGQYNYKGYGAGGDYNTHLMELVVTTDKKDMELVEIRTDTCGAGGNNHHKGLENLVVTIVTRQVLELLVKFRNWRK